MRLLGLELSDAGIMLAGSDPVQLLEIDGTECESPGYAFPEKKLLVVGKAAQQKAHLLPRLVISHFWDQLNTEPLDHPGPYTQQNHAEIACAHLAKIWHIASSLHDSCGLKVHRSYLRYIYLNLLLVKLDWQNPLLFFFVRVRIGLATRLSVLETGKQVNGECLQCFG